jgi:hypothetical protein
VHPEAIARLAQQREVHRVVHAHAARALDQRLYYYGAQLVRVPLERLLHEREHAARLRLHALARLAREAVRGRHDHRVEQQRRIALAVERNVGDRERAERLAMVALRQRHEAAFFRPPAIAPVVEAHLERDFHGRGAVVGVEHALERRGREPHQLLGQRDRRLVAEARQQHVLELVDLALERRADRGVVVAEQVHPPRADRVEVAAAVVVLEPDAVAAPDRYRRPALVVLHLRARMPQHGEVAGGKVGVAHSAIMPRRNPSHPQGRHKVATCRERDSRVSP